MTGLRLRNKMYALLVNSLSPEHFKKFWIPHQYLFAEVAKIMVQTALYFVTQEKMLLLKYTQARQT